MPDEIESPCIGVCLLDEQQVCTGCFRHLDEIAAWPAANRDAKRRILRRAGSRKRRAVTGCIPAHRK